MRILNQLRSSLSLRTIIAVGAGLLALLSTTGFVEQHAFSQPTTLKYGLTIGGPLLVFFAAFVRRPLNLFGAVTIVAAPLEPATAQLGGQRISLLIPLLLICFVLIAFESGRGLRRPMLGYVAILAFPLMTVPMFDSSNSGAFRSSLLLLLATGFVAYCIAREPSGGRVVCAAILGSAAFQAAIALWTVESGQQVNLYSSIGGGASSTMTTYVFDGFLRPHGMFDDPISLGNVLCAGIPVAVGMLFKFRRTDARAATLLGLGLVLGGVGASLDRSSWIAAFFGVLVTVWLLPAVERRRATLATAAAFACILAAAIAIGGSTVTGKIWSIFHPTTTSGQSAEAIGNAQGEQNRLLLWRIAFEDGFESHLATGVGIGNITPLMLAHSSSGGAGVMQGTGQYANASSTYLQLLAEAGLWALVLFILIWVAVFHDARAAVRGSPFLGAGMVGSVVAILVCWVTDVVVYGHAVAAWEGVVFGALAGISAQARGVEGDGGAGTGLAMVGAGGDPGVQRTISQVS